MKNQNVANIANPAPISRKSPRRAISKDFLKSGAGFAIFATISFLQ